MMAIKSKVIFMLESETPGGLFAGPPGDLDCHFVSSEEDFVQAVFDDPPHLLVIDEDFKKGEGRNIALMFKEDLVLKHIPIVLLIGQDETVRRVKDVAIDFFFKKDGPADELRLFVKKVLAENFNELDLNPLTGLPGFRSTVLRVEHANRSQSAFSVLCVDLTNLGGYNKIYGDARGDDIIAELSRILQEVVRRHGTADDFLGHLGGDDFILVTDVKTSVAIAEHVIERFDETIPNFYHEEKSPPEFMTVSIVIVDKEGPAGIEMSQVGYVAGQLKQYTKTLSGSSYMKYHARPGALPPQHLPFEVRLPSQRRSVQVSPRAGDGERPITFLDQLIREKRLRTVYQPIVDMKTKKIVGYEALTRSTGDQAVEPSHLFEMARTAGRVRDLDRLCVECALETGQALGPGQKLFLNLNHETLLDAQTVKGLFAGKGKIGFENLVIEVTEQSLLRSFNQIREALMELKNQGVSVAVDDVGGGAVSLRDVTVLKPDYIKFDRSLVRQVDSNIPKQQVILSMILFAESLQATTIAEGIETRKEYEALKMCGIPLGQGYYFAKPGPAFPELSS
jgi:diguanylate cyclase (GGDEF)-like protein